MDTSVQRNSCDTIKIWSASDGPGRGRNDRLERGIFAATGSQRSLKWAPPSRPWAVLTLAIKLIGGQYSYLLYGMWKTHRWVSTVIDFLPAVLMSNIDNNGEQEACWLADRSVMPAMLIDCSIAFETIGVFQRRDRPSQSRD
jgi:hypothetical protein